MTPVVTHRSSQISSHREEKLVLHGNFFTFREKSHTYTAQFGISGNPGFDGQVGSIPCESIKALVAVQIEEALSLRQTGQSDKIVMSNPQLQQSNFL